MKKKLKEKQKSEMKKRKKMCKNKVVQLKTP